MNKLNHLCLLLVLLLFPFISISAQEMNISGVGIDNDGLTMPGVSVSVMGTTTGTITDIDGHFYIEVPDKSSILVITYVGFKTQEIPVGNNINFNITLLEDVEALDEVVVVGYGNQKKLSVIGSVQTLEPADRKSVV